MFNPRNRSFLKEIDFEPVEPSADGRALVHHLDLPETPAAAARLDPGLDGLEDELTRLFDHRVDLVSTASLHSQLRDGVMPTDPHHLGTTVSRVRKIG